MHSVCTGVWILIPLYFLTSVRVQIQTAPITMRPDSTSNDVSLCFISARGLIQIKLPTDSWLDCGRSRNTDSFD